jgi:translation elongation factor EF-Tu-like GTPase
LWNSITNPNSYRYRDRDGHTDCHVNCNCDGHTDHNSNSYVDAISYNYAKTYSNAETPCHTKASSDPPASSVTGNTHLEKSNQESRKDHEADFSFEWG